MHVNRTLRKLARVMKANRSALPFDSSENAYAQAERSLKGMTLPATNGASFGGFVKNEAGSLRSKKSSG